VVWQTLLLISTLCILAELGAGVSAAMTATVATPMNAFRTITSNIGAKFLPLKFSPEAARDLSPDGPSSLR
jgi:hypothetical protein